MTTRRIEYKNFAGFVIRGDKQWLPSTVNKENHLDKATWLTSAVEVGSFFGTVQSYDGAAMSAGIEHQIAVLPKTMKQGGLWDLLMKIEESVESSTSPTITRMFNKFHEAGWYLDPRGILRNSNNGTEVSGNEIRNEFTPLNGKVPSSGPNYEKAHQWIEIFSNVFSDPTTYPAQIKQAKLGLLELHKALESRVYEKYCNVKDASVAREGKNITSELDLAMCVYHSYSVNAPSRGRQVLEEVLSKNLKVQDFSKELVKALGTNTYANWKARYIRTWTAAKNSGLFCSSLFLPNSVMPPSL